MAKGKNEYKNLFEAVTDTEKKKTLHTHLAAKENESSDTQTEVLFKAARTMYEEISLGLEHAFRFNDLTPSQFRAYLSRPQNFSQKEWADIQTEKKLNEEKLKNLLHRIQAIAESVNTDIGASFELTVEKSPQKAIEDQEAVDTKSDQKASSFEVSASAQETKKDDAPHVDEIKKKPPLTKRGWINMR